MWIALAGVAQWTERHPANQKVADLVSSQGTCPGCGPGPQLGACRRQPVNFSFLLFLPPFSLSKNKSIKSLKTNKQKNYVD